MKQLILQLSNNPRYDFESCVVHAGISSAIDTIKKVFSQVAEAFPFLFLYGQPGTGKTHLLNATAELIANTTSAVLKPAAITFEADIEEPDTLKDLIAESSGHEIPPAVIVDNVHLAFGTGVSHLWNLSNKMIRKGSPLLIGSLYPPDDLFQANDHIRSRLSSGLVLRLENPDDHARILIMDKLAADKSIKISRDVYNYLVSRRGRNVKELERVVDILDQASLSLHRRITVPFIKLLEESGSI